MAVPPSPVHVEGFSYGAIAGWGTFITLLGIIAKQVNPWRKQTIDAEQQLRNDLLARVEKLEKILDRKDAQHAAERALDRHEINNLTQCFDALVLMLEAAPSSASEILLRVKAMREAQIAAEAIEKATIHAAEITAAAGAEAK